MARAGEALAALAHEVGIPTSSIAPPSMTAETVADTPGQQTLWIEANAARLGVEVERVDLTHGDLVRLPPGTAPSLLTIRNGVTPLLLVVVSAGRRRVSLLAPDLSRRRVGTRVLRRALCETLEAPLAKEIDGLLEGLGIVEARRRHVRAALLRDRLGSTRIASGWLLRLPPGSSMRIQGWMSGLSGRLLGLAAAHATAYALWILSWWIVGRAALEGRLDRGWLLAWALLLATVIPFELLVTWLQGRISIYAGALLKRRLLFGALRLDPEEIRHQGAGQLLGRVIEAQAIEALALSGGFLALMAGLELAIAAILLATVTAWLTIALVACVVATAAFSWRFFEKRRTWTGRRLAMTHDLVERLVGNRTRLAQEERDAWHEVEDGALASYTASSEAMDRTAAWLIAAVPRGWLLVAVAVLSPIFISGSAAPGTIAMALGGILLAYRAFRRLATGATNVAGAAIAWNEAADIYHAAARPETVGAPQFAVATSSSNGNGALLEGHELSFRYDDRAEAAVRGCSLEIRRGDRLLLEGPSGGGKSTLASLLTGIRKPAAGLLLLGGLDRATLGDHAWRRRVVAVPQFHENHVFMGTFLFNALMGGEWPPSQRDVEQAEVLCHELGLGGLLARMPAGFLQQVGETGWQLSHGERSRLFIARALLQRGDMLVLDESFAQLDPDNLQRALQCVLKRAPTVMVIAHP